MGVWGRRAGKLRWGLLVGQTTSVVVSASGAAGGDDVERE